MISKKRSSYNWIVAIVCIILNIYMVVNIAYSKFFSAYLIVYISIIALIIGYFIYNKSTLFYGLLFFIPLSVPIKLIGDFELQFPTEPIIAMLTILGILSINNSLEYYKKLWQNPITKIIFIELIWLVICSLNSEMVLVSLKYTVVRICYAMVFYVLTIQWFQKYKKPYFLFLIYAIGFIIPIINALNYHAQWNFSQKFSFDMPKPFFNDHTVYGACLAFLIPVLLALVNHFKLFFKNQRMIFLLLPIVLFIIVAEYFSFSRASWLSLAMCGVLYIALKIGLTSKVFITSILIGFVLLWLNQNLVLEQMNQSTSMSNKDDLKEQIASITNIQTDVSNTERINRWKSAIRMGIEKPIAGFGPRTYKFLYAKYQNKEDLNRISTFNGDKGNAHSEYLSFFAECGIIGMVIHSLFFLIPLLSGINLVQKCKLKKNKIMATAFVLSFFTYFIHGFFNGFMEEEKMSSLVFISMAVVYYIDEAEKNNLEII